jgi:anhydro-N-acetylmuramic acid kinase
MSELYMGLISGTSADGIDAALVDFSQKKPAIVATFFHEFAAPLRQEIFALCHPGQNEINRMAELDVKLGEAFATAANTLLKNHSIDPSSVRAIGSHGQTIRHLPQQQFTLQIGDPNIIAARTGITTIGDFRRRDLAHGGQGAPLVPAFHQQIFSEKNINRAIVNIGGIANVTLLTSDISGFDTGPGNTLLDAWTEKHLQKACDKNGEWAASGKINSELLNKLLSDPFFKLAPPKSSGREYFNLTWLEKYLSPTISAVDVQATLVELTAKSILAAIPFSNGEIFVCGGGAKNSFLMLRLKKLAENILVESTEKLGVHPDWVEAMAFAWLAKQTLEKKPGNVLSVTGAKQQTVLGGIYFN